jgi:hypothetical protein
MKFHKLYEKYLTEIKKPNPPLSTKEILNYHIKTEENINEEVLNENIEKRVYDVLKKGGGSGFYIMDIYGILNGFHPDEVESMKGDKKRFIDSRGNKSFDNYVQLMDILYKLFKNGKIKNSEDRPDFEDGFWSLK